MFQPPHSSTLGIGLEKVSPALSSFSTLLYKNDKYKLIRIAFNLYNVCTKVPQCHMCIDFLDDNM
jgi:hypothetical protein